MRSTSLADRVLTIANILIGPVSFLASVYACICLGQMLPKMKVFGAFCIYVGFSIVEGILNSGMESFLRNTGRSSGNGQVIFNLLLQAVIVAVGYFLSTYIMKHRLNLE